LQSKFNFGTFDPGAKGPGGEDPTRNCLYNPLTDPKFINVDLGRALIRAVGALLPDLPSGVPWKNVTVRDDGTVVGLPTALTGLPDGSDPRRGPTDPKKTILQELCMQKDAEDQWTNLLLTLAPSCFGTTQLVGDTSVLVDAARVAHSLALFECTELSVPIPRDVATSLDQGVRGSTS
jgi:hypothetical protein